MRNTERIKEYWRIYNKDEKHKQEKKRNWNKWYANPKNKEWRSKYNKLYWKRNLNMLREIKRNYANENRKKLNEWIIKNKKKVSIYQKEYYNRNPLKVKAHILSRKIKISKLCERCKNNIATDKHHPNYFEPLNVVFLCRDCHHFIHRKPMVIQNEPLNKTN